MSRSVSIRTSLVRNLVIGVLVLGGAIMATTFLGTRRAVRALSAQLISQITDQVDDRLERLFGHARTGVVTLERRLLDNRNLALGDPDELTELLVRLLDRTPITSAAMVADGKGRELMVLRTEDGWRRRRIDPARWGEEARVRTWKADGAPGPEQVETIDYDPRTRPWYRGAIERAAALPDGAEPDKRISWTSPYTFFTTREPGITTSMAIDLGDGLERVVGFDVRLTDLSDFTRSLAVSGHGKAFVVTADGRLIGLPRDSRFDDPGTRQESLLRKLDAIDIPEIAAAVNRIRALSPEQARHPFRYRSAGEDWWAAGRPFHLSAGRQFFIGVLVPERDVIGNLMTIRLGILVAVTLLLTVGVMRVVVLARRYSRPIEALVAESDRISEGDLEPSEPIATNVDEVRRLAEAHDRMRAGLRTLLKLERDLQLAREIQQGTFPATMPRVPGFDLHAWNEPADETGGDTYDVIGFAAAEEGDGRQAPRRLTSAASTDHALLLLADATGHGIGPALSATQLRSMIRMAMRTGVPLAALAGHLNEQLCQDLPDARFITAWLGELDARTKTLVSFSAGQGPLLHFRAATGACEVLHADTMPFGIVAGLPIEIGAPIPLEPGDLFAVISDGILEAARADGEQFGTHRTAALLAEHHERPAAEIVDRLREAVHAFTDGAPAADDRTVIVIRRITD